MQRRLTRILVTGGCGFIASNFILSLLKRRKDLLVVNLDKLTYAGNRMNLLSLERSREQGQGPDSRYVFVHGDIADPELVPRLLTEHRIQAVLNFAAESHVDRSIHDSSPFITTNIQGTHNLLEASRKAEIELFLQVSTDEVYGTLGLEGQFTEETPLAPNSPYSASKASADLLVRAYHETYGLPTVITRCSNNYGPFQFPEKLIPLMITLAWEDKPLPVYGDGANVRDWIHVLDHCRGVELAMDQGRPGAVYNFGGDAERTNIQVVTAILDLLGKPHSLIRYVQDRPGHDRRYAMDFTLAARELGFAPSVTFEQGLQETIQWYEGNREWLRRVQDGSYRDFMDAWYGERR
ncbi:dTDP-glucose 4,6-dehydratase [Desulfonatronum sp. SC1]|uniref:dTDP-glucose 4,6-dehydratase n=1 Tax=Desulfonatronum sp. SC1 TaxID=2109626 RepID=UPI000D3129D7|nr:dTDP-glucose 4,6-dehydratase [Desulfonatronum sp. SC1]PTN39028.1 dTDP-glucose 4,6-dehydratase [Desulfonatronum sp. SC1]